MCVCVCVCVRACVSAYLAVHAQVQVVSGHLEDQRPRLRPLGDGGLVDGRREEGNVVVDVWGERHVRNKH